MEPVRVLNRPEDFDRLGINPKVVEQWEDGQRRNSEPGAMENWYFDAIMEDGTKVVVVFMTKTGETRHLPTDTPNLRIQITTPDGKSFEDFILPPIEECETRKGGCYLNYGSHTFTGDLVDYDIVVNPVNGIGCNLHLHVMVKPFRPGTGYIAFGEDEMKEYTWVTFPRCEVSGSIIYDGETHEVKGTGYHDHQFHNTDSMSTIHHWFWGRQSLEDYTVAIFDIVANEKYGFKRIPIFCVYDKNGEVIFENTEGGECEILELQWSEEAKKDFPKAIQFTYDHGEMKVQFTVKWKEEIDVRTPATIFGSLNEELAAKFDKMGLDPSYIRYHADAYLVITEGEKVTKSSGDMIYEYAYFGKHDTRAHIELNEKS